MKSKTITGGVVVGVIMTLTFSMPLWAAEGKKPTDLNAEKIEKPKETKSPAPETTIKFPGPKISTFSCESLIRGYNTHLFDGFGAYLSVTCGISAKQGLRKFEILFNRHRIYEETFSLVGPMVTNKTYRDLRIDPSPARPARSGPYNLQARVEDSLGAVATRDIRLICDMERPTIHSVRPANGETVYKDGESVDITFEFDVSDDFSGVYFVYMGGWYGSVRDYTPPFSITFRDIERDTHFDVEVVDREGNIQPYNLDVYVRPRRALSPGPSGP